MRLTARCLANAAGFYIALHPWLTKEGLCKVGFSANLSKRLSMPNYTTCFADGWRFGGTIECTPDDAFLLEQAVLSIFRDDRLDGRELLYADPVELLKTAQRIASDVLRIETKLLSNPSYEHQKEASLPLEAPVGNNAAPSFSAAARLVELSKGIDEFREALVREKSVCYAEPDNTDDLVAFDSLCDARWATMISASFSAVALRDYQVEAVDRTAREIMTTGKAILQMACRSGKTPVAHRIMSHYFEKSQLQCKVLYIVPGLSLLRQTAQKLRGYGLPPNVGMLLIGSDPVPVDVGDQQLVMTTCADDIEQFFSENQCCVVISTYASSHLLVKSSQSIVTFDLTVFDEAHRACGRSELSAYNSALLTPPSGHRLFLTATPTYDTPIRMDDVSMFGGIAYRFYLREGIDRKVVNDFKVVVVLGQPDEMHNMILDALRSVDKLLVFCKNISQAETLHALVESHLDGGQCDCIVAHSRMSHGSIPEALLKFRESKRAVLFNVRLFQEGVEIPDLNGVFFAAPRYSPRDIVQSICRPLNRLDGKPPSVVFLPASFDPDRPPDDPVNMGHFSTLVPFTDALMAEDPSLFEYLIDPKKNNYNIEVVGLRSLKTSNDVLQRVVLPHIRRGVRYSKRNTDRLQKPDALPWKTAFAELQRVVATCHRYPKINDAWIVGDARISLSQFYRYCRRGYALFLSSGSTFLQPFQLRDLESLPSWRTYGVNGPYPWAECLSTLTAFVAKYNRFPPLDIHRGGYVGLDATPFERLSGALCNINQQDKVDVLSVSVDKQRDLDALCAKYPNLQWRKRRDESGCHASKSEQSCITLCYNQFKQMYASGDARFAQYVAQHFPGYPQKHLRMERLDVQASGAAPPRLKNRGEVSIKRMKAKGVTGPIASAVVVCRTCRVEVEANMWHAHVSSDAHQLKLKQS